MKLLTFGPGTQNVLVRVPIVDDENVESDETFFGNLRIPLGTPNTGSIFYQPGRATATIQDNDCKKPEYGLFLLYVMYRSRILS